MPEYSVLGYAIANESHVDAAAWAVAIMAIPLCALYRLIRQKFFGVAGSVMTWDKAVSVFLAGSALVPLSLLVLGTFSPQALSDLLASSRYTLSIGGSVGLLFSMKEILQ